MDSGLARGWPSCCCKSADGLAWLQATNIRSAANSSKGPILCLMTAPQRKRSPTRIRPHTERTIFGTNAAAEAIPLMLRLYSFRPGLSNTGGGRMHPPGICVCTCVCLASFTTHYSLLTTHESPVTNHQSRVTIHCARRRAAFRRLPALTTEYAGHRVAA